MAKKNETMDFDAMEQLGPNLDDLPRLKTDQEDLPMHYISLMQGSSDPVKEGECMAGEIRVRPGMVRLQINGENTFVATCVFRIKDHVERIKDGETVIENGEPVMDRRYNYFLRVVDGWPDGTPQPKTLLLQMVPWGSGSAALHLNDIIEADDGLPFRSLLKFSHKVKESKADAKGETYKYLAWVVERLETTPDDMLEELIPDYMQAYKMGVRMLPAGESSPTNGAPQLTEGSDDGTPF